ncbi:MAG: hypothetical protein COU31_02215 [Candidatus Magasanikbacteria bacterium CG10_big_fil_rev_8_21_14_0_10_40_10]|uniref:TNFR-Cys domain-containing protein n=1 Tax=Candidatus Magasanikbacteria bacterium CG10_big_fil_rev_8_21_14_0_10_40_10 TaxID=1974648 RepID=A0A2M6W4B9_9BACT|nr:MAG: hypothetical protein COU31_02215 [Candidatus Magasanikbacteria bacterium CG10_big_fil_rev_8_21_14_0_10_40_10]
MKIKIKVLLATAVGLVALVLVLAGILLNTKPSQASAQSYGTPVSCYTLQAGDNIKPNRIDMPAIWNIGDDGKIWPYLDGDDFKTWHTDESYEGHFKLVTPECLSQYDAATSLPLYINRRPGSGIIRNKISSQLYAILPNNTKAPITDESAKALYGANYTVRVLEPAAFFNYYNTATTITGSNPAPHAGMLVENNNGTYYVTQCGQLREVTSLSFLDNHFKNKYVQKVSGSLLGSLSASEKISDKLNALTSYTQMNANDDCGGTATPVNPLTCPLGTSSCNGSCLDLGTNSNHCGVCNNACGSGNYCNNGKCEGLSVACQNNQKKCGNKCVNYQTDASNCGDCGVTCATGEVCSSGVCASTCPNSETKCSNQCTNILADNNNCGSCGKACSTGYSCVSGSCQAPVASCQTGYTSCNNTCVNTLTDKFNCGSCDHICSSIDSCVNGTCSTVAPSAPKITGIKFYNPTASTLGQTNVLNKVDTEDAIELIFSEKFDPSAISPSFVCGSDILFSDPSKDGYATIGYADSQGNKSLIYLKGIAKFYLGGVVNTQTNSTVYMTADSGCTKMMLQFFTTNISLGISALPSGASVPVSESLTTGIIKNMSGNWMVGGETLPTHTGSF